MQPPRRLDVGVCSDHMIELVGVLSGDMLERVASEFAREFKVQDECARHVITLHIHIPP